MRFYLFFYLFFACISFLFSQSVGKIQGFVFYKDGSPCSNATVFIENKLYYTYTREDGFYVLDNVNYGIYKLSVKEVGRDKHSINITVNSVENQKNIYLDYNAAMDLEEVVVKSKNKITNIKEQGFNVNNINMKPLEMQSLQTTELLNRSVGVKIRQNAGLGSSTNFNINGLSGNSVRVFIDGIPSKNYGSSFSLSSIPTAMIERVEVYKGVLPIELAQDALGGGINIVLKKQYKNQLKTSYSFGSFNTHQWNMNGIFASKNGLSVTLDAFYNYSDNNYKVWGDNVYVTNSSTGKISYIKANRFHDAYQSKGVKTDVAVVGKKWADELRIGLILSDSYKDIQTGATMDVVYGNRKSERNGNVINIKYSKKRFLDYPLNVSTFSTLSITNRKIIDTIPDMYNWHGKVIRDDKGNKITWKKGGGEGSASTLANNKEQHFSNRSAIEYKITPLQSIKFSSLFNQSTRNVDDPYLSKRERSLMDTRFLSKRILGVAYNGVFFDRKLTSTVFFKNYLQLLRLTEPIFEKYSNVLTSKKHNKSVSHNGYGFVASYKILPKLNLKISAEKAFRLPSFTELLGNTSDNIDPSYNLKPEKSNNINIGLEGLINIKENHSLSVDFNYFIRDVSDMIVRNVKNNISDTYAFENLGKIKSLGFDVELKYLYKDKFTLIGNFSSFNTRFNLKYDEHGSEFIYYNDRLRNNPFLTANINANYDIINFIQKKSILSINYNWGYTHWFFRNWESLGGRGKTIIPGYKIHDISLSYKFPNKKLSLNIVAKNISDEQVFDNWALQKPGRSFFLKINYNFF